MGSTPATPAMRLLLQIIGVYINKFDEREDFMKLLTDEEYNEQMERLGLVEDPEFGKFFLGDMAFLMNLEDDVNEIGDLIQVNSGGHPTYMSQTLMNFSMSGAELTIGPGAIDEYGVKQQKALYCTNYRELYSNKNTNDEKKMRSI